jgi:hypothetical protein
VGNFLDAGARCVVVPGVTDPVRGVEIDLVPHAALTTCRLRAEPADRGRRLAARGGPTYDLAQGLAYANVDRHVGGDADRPTGSPGDPPCQAVPGRKGHRACRCGFG